MTPYLAPRQRSDSVSGTGVNGVLLIGAHPFIGSSSYQLDKLLRRAGLEKEAFWIGTPDALDTIKPQVIVPMGEQALRHTTGDFKILRHRGRVFRHPTKGTWVVPTLHPQDLYPKRGAQAWEFQERNPARFTGTVIWDLHRAIQVAREGFSRVEPHYDCDPPPHVFHAFVIAYEEALRTDPETMLSWDIETPYKIRANDEGEFDEGQRDNTILRISFSYRPYHGVSVPWSGPYLPAIRRLLASKGVHVVWNGDTFDVPLVRKQGVEVNGEVHDYMWGFHLWQSDLPKGLEFVTSYFSDLLPWKHLNNADPARYSAIDADAALRNAIGIKAALQKSGQWEAFVRHVVRLDPILYEAGHRGSRIHLRKQFHLLKTLTTKKAELSAQAQGYVPQELKPRKRYKKLPIPPEVKAALPDGKCRTDIFYWDGREFEAVEVIGQVKQCEVCKAIITSKGEHQKGKGNPCKKAGVATVPGVVREWDEILDFNPNSSEQIKAYIRHFRHPMGYDKKDREKESANSQHLARLAKKYPGHPIYGSTVELHKVSKALGTYVVGFTPDASGLIHTTYDHTPSTWRLASKNVNLQNVGKRDTNPYSKDARKQIIARPGHVFVQADSSAIEAVFVGHFMGDADYIDTARKGVHAKLACFKLGLPFTQANIALVKGAHKSMYDRCKVVVHGTSYGMSPGLMVETNPELFPTRKVAEEFQDLLFQMAPRLKEWQHEIRVRAHKETYLVNPWGYRHYFYQVFTVGFEGGLKLADDAKRCVAFLPQSSAGAFMMDNLVLLGDTWLRPFLPAHVSVHDGYCVDVPRHLKDRAIETLVEILTRPIPEMGGLRVGCEVEVGVNWGDMETVRAVAIQEAA